MILKSNPFPGFYLKVIEMICQNTWNWFELPVFAIMTAALMVFIQITSLGVDCIIIKPKNLQKTVKQLCSFYRTVYKNQYLYKVTLCLNNTPKVNYSTFTCTVPVSINNIDETFIIRAPSFWKYCLLIIIIHIVHPSPQKLSPKVSVTK